MPKMSIQACPRREPTGDQVDAHMLVAHQGIAGAKQEDRRKQVPLYFEKGVRTVVDGIAHDRVARGDERDDQDQPDDALADELGEPVDQAGKFE
jgi:hypothetical protein